jgi:hypothetical protein
VASSSDTGAGLTLRRRLKRRRCQLSTSSHWTLRGEKPPVTTAAKTPRKDLKMDLDAEQFYQDNPLSTWILCDLHSPEAVKFVHDARGVFRERSDLIALGPHHMIVVLLAGLSSERAA